MTAALSGAFGELLRTGRLLTRTSLAPDEGSYPFSQHGVSFQIETPNVLSPPSQRGPVGGQKTSLSNPVALMTVQVRFSPEMVEDQMLTPDFVAKKVEKEIAEMASNLNRPLVLVPVSGVNATQDMSDFFLVFSQRWGGFLPSDVRRFLNV